MEWKEPICAPIEGVNFVFVPHMIKGAMAIRFVRRVPGLTLDQGMDAAVATWETEWSSDPAPRTLARAIEEVDSELEHWGDDA